MRRLMRAGARLGPRAASARLWPPLLFFTDPTRTPRPEAVVGALPRGAGVVFRAFGAPDAAAAGARLARLARGRGVRFIVGADPALAARLGAWGLHLPQRAAYRRGLILAWRRRFIVTAAAHDARAIREARAAGVQAVVVSPVFASASPSAGRPLGRLRFRRMVLGAGLPVYALGGMDSRTARALGRCGAVGLAAVEAVVEAARI